MDLVASLKQLLADQVTFTLMTQGAHWNVEGPMFSQFHAFFSEIYEDVSGSIDPTAENIRKMGAYAPFTLPTLNGLRSVEDQKTSTDPIEMCVALYDANETILKSIEAAQEMAQEADEEGIMNFLAERDDMHKKWRWQLKATIKK